MKISSSIPMKPEISIEEEIQSILPPGWKIWDDGFFRLLLSFRDDYPIVMIHEDGITWLLDNPRDEADSESRALVERIESIIAAS